MPILKPHRRMSPTAVSIAAPESRKETHLQLVQGGEKYAMPQPPEGRSWNRVDLPNIGREANTFAEHLVRRYDSLAAYTIFSQVSARTKRLPCISLFEQSKKLPKILCSKVFQTSLALQHQSPINMRGSCFLKSGQQLAAHFTGVRI